MVRRAHEIIARDLVVVRLGKRVGNASCAKVRPLSKGLGDGRHGEQRIGLRGDVQAHQLALRHISSLKRPHVGDEAALGVGHKHDGVGRRHPAQHTGARVRVIGEDEDEGDW